MTFIITQFILNLDWKASVSNYLALRLELLKHTFCSKNTNIGIIFQLQKSNAVWNYGFYSSRKEIVRNLIVSQRKSQRCTYISCRICKRSHNRCQQPSNFPRRSTKGAQEWRQPLFHLVGWVLLLLILIYVRSLISQIVKFTDGEQMTITVGVVSEEVVEELLNIWCLAGVC